MLGRLHQVENGELDDRVLQAAGDQLVDRDLGDELGVGVRLGVGAVETVLVLDVDHLLAAEVLSHEVAARVGAIGRKQPLLREPHPHAVGRHPAEDHGVRLRDDQRDSRQPCATDDRDAVLGHQLAEHFGVLAGNLRAETREHAGRHAEPGGDRVQMPGPGPGPGPDQQLVLAFGGDQFLDHRVDGGPTPVDDRLPADLEHRGVREDPVVGGRSRGSEDVLVGQGPREENRLELRCLVRHVHLPSLATPGTRRARQATAAR